MWWFWRRREGKWVSGVWSGVGFLLLFLLVWGGVLGGCWCGRFGGGGGGVGGLRVSATLGAFILMI